MKVKFLIAFLLGFICSPIYALHLTFHYNPSALSFKSDSTEYGVFEKIVWANAYSEAEDVGMPDIPAFCHAVPIADNIIVDTIKITLLNGNSDVLTHPIMPRQYPIPTGYPIEEPQFVKNESVYQTNYIFPHSSLINYHIDQSRDGKFLSLAIVPFQYNPVTNVYTVYSMAEVEVFTHEEDNRLQASRTGINIGIPYYEYVIITSSQLAPAFEPFAQWKRAKGYNVGIVNINDILTNPYTGNGDEISGISDNAGKLRQYLIYSYNSAQTKYVLLGGDSAIIPIRYGAAKKYNDNTHIYDTVIIPSDFYYSELNCNWDANHNGLYGEGSDLVDCGAEVYVGRLLCNSVEEVHNWTQKVLQYEINPGNGEYTYLGRALFSQADQMQHMSEAENMQQLLQGNLSVTILSESPSYNDSFPSFPKGADIVTALNNTHYGLYSNLNHGGPLHYGTATYLCDSFGHDVHYGVAAIDEYDEDDALLYSAKHEDNNGFDNLTNVSFPTIVYSTSCENMPFDQYKTPAGTYNLGRVYTSQSYGGGPAYIGNTRHGFVYESHTLYRHFLDSILLKRNNHIGIAEAKSKFAYHYNYTRHSHNLLGCPEMSLYTHIPSTFGNLAVNNANNHMTISTGTADSIECRICLSGNVGGVYRQFVYTDRSNVSFDTIPEEYTLVVSMPNYIPYIFTNDTCLIQNLAISNSHIYDGCDTFYIGSDITSLQPFGDVIIENGGNVTINVGDKVIIKNNFKVKLGGRLLIH